MINSILGKRAGEPGAAKVGITQTTHDIAGYDPKNDTFKVKLWDLPGGYNLETSY